MLLGRWIDGRRGHNGRALGSQSIFLLQHDVNCYLMGLAVAMLLQVLCNRLGVPPNELRQFTEACLAAVAELWIFG